MGVFVPWPVAEPSQTREEKNKSQVGLEVSKSGVSGWMRGCVE